MDVKPITNFFYQFFVGKALSLALAQKGVCVTVVDSSEERGKEVALLIEKENEKFHLKLKFPPAIFIRCDVTNTSKYSTHFPIAYKCITIINFYALRYSFEI